MLVLFELADSKIKEWKTYVNDVYGFQIDYPNGFEASDPGQGRFVKFSKSGQYCFSHDCEIVIWIHTNFESKSHACVRDHQKAYHKNLLHFYDSNEYRM